MIFEVLPNPKHSIILRLHRECWTYQHGIPGKQLWTNPLRGKCDCLTAGMTDSTAQLDVTGEKFCDSTGNNQFGDCYRLFDLLSLLRSPGSKKVIKCIMVVKN